MMAQFIDIQERIISVIDTILLQHPRTTLLVTTITNIHRSLVYVVILWATLALHQSIGKCQKFN